MHIICGEGNRNWYIDSWLIQSILDIADLFREPVIYRFCTISRLNKVTEVTQSHQMFKMEMCF